MPTMPTTRSDTLLPPLASKAPPMAAPNPTAKRLGYLGLSLLGGGLAYVVGMLSVAVLYGGSPLGLLVLALALGFLAGGFFFLVKAFRKAPKPYKQMSRAERKREWRGFWLSWLATTLGFALYVISQITR